MYKSLQLINTLTAAAGVVFASGCVLDDQGTTEQLAGVASTLDIPALATFDSAAGLRFASDDVARQWTEEAAGVWRHEDGAQRLIIGKEGHRWAVAQLEDELAALYAEGADDNRIEVKEAHLALQRDALAMADKEIQSRVTCDISAYLGPSGPLYGFVGGAALVQIVCQGGTVAFTVETQVCTQSTGCSPVNRSSVIVDDTPFLWGTVRAGTGVCSSFMSVTPPGIAQTAHYICA